MKVIGQAVPVGSAKEVFYLVIGILLRLSRGTIGKHAGDIIACMRLVGRRIIARREYRLQCAFRGNLLGITPFLVGYCIGFLRAISSSSGLIFGGRILAAAAAEAALAASSFKIKEGSRVSLF